MKKFVKFLSFVFSIILISFTFSACDNSNRVYKLDDVDSSDVAILTLFSSDNKEFSKYGVLDLGHAWLSITNTSTDTISLYGVELGGGETCSFGTWSIFANFGIYYNVESNYIHKTNKYSGRYSLSIGINQTDVENIVEFMKNNNTWTPLKNCSYFAFNVWNLVATDTEKIDKPTLIYSPSYLVNFIKKFDEYEIDKNIPNDQNIIYFDGTNTLEYSLEP